jgi:hypothetical protein
VGIEDDLVRTAPSSHSQPSVPWILLNATPAWRQGIGSHIFLEGHFRRPMWLIPPGGVGRPAVKPGSSEASRLSTAQERSQMQAICVAAAGERTARLLILGIAPVGQNPRTLRFTPPAWAYVMSELIHSRQLHRELSNPCSSADISDWQRLRAECVFTTQCFYKT